MLEWVTDLQVTLMGMGAFLGGMMTLTPECLQPRMAPPLASTMKLTRNLKQELVRREEEEESQSDGQPWPVSPRSEICRRSTLMLQTKC